MLLLIIFAITREAYSQKRGFCQNLSEVTDIFPTNQELYSLEMSDLFAGVNLTYECDQCAIPLYNLLNQQLDQPLQLNATALDLLYDGRNTLILFNTSTSYGIYNISVRNQNAHISTTYLYQASEQLLHCFTISAVVDCFTETQMILYNLLGWPVFVANSSGIPLYTKILIYKRYLYQGMFYSSNSSISIYQLEPSGLVSFIGTLYTELAIVDFTIANNSTMYILNKTKSFATYVISDNGELEYQTTHQVYLNSSNQDCLAISVIQDVETTEKWYIYIATTRDILNVDEHVAHQNNTVIGRKFESPKLESNLKTSILLSQQFMVITQASQQVYFKRGGLAYNQSLLEGIIVQYLYSTEFTEILFLDPPSDQLVSASSELQLFNLTIPQLLGVFDASTNSSGNLSIKAISKLDDPQKIKCIQNISYQIISVNQTDVFENIPSYELPSKSLYPRNMTLNINYLFSGPLLTATGKVINDNSSSIVYASYNQVILNHDVFPKNVSQVVGFYDDLDDSQIILMVSGLNIYGYLCEGDKSFFCVNIFTNNSQNEILSIQAQQLDNLGKDFAYVFETSAAININYAVFNYSLGVFLSQPLEFIPLDQETAGTKYLLLGNLLYLLVPSLSQINVLKFNPQTYKLELSTTISPTSFDFPFLPINMTGNYKYFGNTLFIDNYYEFLIINIIEGRIVLLSRTSYQFQNSTSRQINTVGPYFIVTFFLGNNQQISQWDVRRIHNPVFVKNLPLYNNSLESDQQIISDNFFLYVKTSLRSINIYNPYLPYHSCLFKQSNLTTPYFAAISALKSSYIIYGSEPNIAQIYPYNFLTFIPGYYSTAYQFNTSYSIQVSNQLSSTYFNLTQNMTIFNSQLGIQVNQTQFQLANNFSQVKSGINIYPLNLTNATYGDIASYAVYCENCDDSNITFEIINYLQKQNLTYVADLKGVEQIINYQDQDFLVAQTTTGLYIVNSSFGFNYASHLVYNYTQQFQSCEILVQSLFQILSICQEQLEDSNGKAQFQLQFFSYVNNSMSLLSSFIFQQLAFITKATLLGDYLFIQGIKQKNSLNFILYLYQITTSGLVEAESYTCPNHNYGVIDYSVAPLYNYTINNSNYVYLSTFYTCKSPDLLYYFPCLIINRTLINCNRQTQTINTQTQQSLFSNTYYQQILPIYIKNETIVLLLTTNNVMDFIFALTFNSSYQETKPEFQTSGMNTSQLLTTIPPYGTFTQANRASYNQGYLALTFYQISTSALTSFISVYNLNQTFSPSVPILMIGGVYQDLLGFPDQKLLIIPPNKNSDASIMFYTNPVNYSNLAYMILQPQVEIVLNCSGPFGTKDFVLVAQNFYTREQMNFSITYEQPPQTPLLPWWSWLVVMIALVLGGACITIVGVKCRKEENDYSELEL